MNLPNFKRLAATCAAWLARHADDPAYAAPRHDPEPEFILDDRETLFTPEIEVKAARQQETVRRAMTPPPCFEPSPSRFLRHYPTQFGYVVETEHGRDLVQLNCQADVDSLHARLGALIHPGFAAPLHSC